MKRLEVATPDSLPVIRQYNKIPPTPKGGALLKTTFAGICHSDVYLAADEKISTGKDSWWKLSESFNLCFPIVLGHEIAGKIYSIGEDAKKSGTTLKVGDNVILYPYTGCDVCGHCCDGFSNYCKTPFTFGIKNDGGFQEYVSVYKLDILVKVPDTIPMSVAAMLPCSGITGYSAMCKIKPTVEYFVNEVGKATLLIIGAGGLGTWCIQIAKASLPKNTRILVADITKEKLSTALAHGADDTVLWDPSLSDEELVKMTQAKGANGDINAVIDFVNNSGTAKRGLECLTKGGAMSLVGLYGGSVEVPLPVYALGLKELFGIFAGSLHQMKDLVNLVATTKLMPPEMSYVSLDEVPAVFEKLKNGKITGRALVKF